VNRKNKNKLVVCAEFGFLIVTTGDARALPLADKSVDYSRGLKQEQKILLYFKRI